MELKINHLDQICGELDVPSDKSITHRALLLASIATEPSLIHGSSNCEDCLHTIAALEQFGVHFSLSKQNTIQVVPPKKWRTPSDPVFCGNSGTLMRLLTGLVASQEGLEATLQGDVSLSKRPMGRVITPLERMGAKLSGARSPLMIVGARLKPISYVSHLSSAQVKSCLMFAGLHAEGETCITQSYKSRDHTERMLRFLEVPVTEEKTSAGYRVKVSGKTELSGFEVNIPGDFSSAAFWITLAAMTPNSKLLMKNVGVNPTRTGLFNVFSQAKIHWELSNEKKFGDEPVADLYIQGKEQLEPFQISPSQVPLMIDELPILAILATQCNGTSIFKGLEELRYKESDRLHNIVINLRKMGAVIETQEDGFFVLGPTKLKNATIDVRGDHRIAMAFTIAGLIAKGETIIKNASCISTSYPDFFTDLEKICTF